jgi:hypothetical protein
MFNFNAPKHPGDSVPSVPILMSAAKRASPSQESRNDEAGAVRSYRQGDVLIVAAPQAAVDFAAEEARVGGRIVLALGEATGQAHAIADLDAPFVPRNGMDRILRIGPPGATVTHAEHAAIELPPGTDAVRRQREYVPGAATRFDESYENRLECMCVSHE